MFKSFLGGIHPNDGKKHAADMPIEVLPLPKEIILPMSQHIGAPCKPTVKVGDLVKRGDVVGTTEAFLHSDIHATTSGRVVKVEDRPHAGAITCLSVVIEPDGLDEWKEGLPLARDWHTMEKDEILTEVEKAGIVGMGGATFPAHIKLKPQKPVDILLINGAECEPYLTADYRLMLEESTRVIDGTQILARALGVDKMMIGIEDNKPKAIEALQKAAQGTKVEICALPTKYPQGAEKMLIKVLTGRTIPMGGLPMDVGVVVQNAGTAAAVYDAVAKGLPLTERITTVSGDAIKQPRNLNVRIGTPFQAAIDYCGGFSETPDKVISGGPMMGFAQADLSVPILKGSSGILGLTKKITAHEDETHCIRCGRCVKACPMGLVPSMLSILGERADYTASRDEFGLMNCIECGSCTFVCPARRNIVQYIRLSKSECRALAAKEKEKQNAEKAKEAKG